MRGWQPRAGRAGPGRPESTGSGLPTEYQKHFVAEAAGGFQLELCGPGQFFKTNSIRDRRGLAAPKNLGADGEMKFIHQSGAEKGIVQFATTFAEQAFHAPFRSQPTHSGGPVEIR